MTTPVPHLLDNIAWHTLAGPHARFSAGSDAARRYAAGFSPIVAFADPERPGFDALRAFCAPGEHFYCSGGPAPAHAGWQVEVETTMFQMVWDAPAPAADDGFDAVPLRPGHVAQMLDLVAIAPPGPFGPRTIELGDYIGCFDGDRLMAMAGERMVAGGFREISGVCTHPDFQGRGLSRRLMETLVGREMRRGETPFLHVMRDNAVARGIYQRMGFRERREVVVRVLARRDG